MARFRLKPKYMTVSGMNEDLERKYTKAAIFIKSAAKELSAQTVDTGNLMGSITETVFWEGDTIVARVGTNVEYAWYIEFGTGIHAKGIGRKTPWRYKDSRGNWHTTSGMEPKPFLYPAVDLHKDDIKKIIKAG